MSRLKHLGVIMDGNARWAKRNRVSKNIGYRRGIEAAERLIMRCKDMNIRYITLYAFSIENWLRPALEVMEIMNILRDYLHGDIKNLIENNVKITFIGDLSKLDQDIQMQMKRVVALSNEGVIEVRFAISYGGHDHLRRAAVDFASYVQKNELKIEELLLESFDEFVKIDHFPMIDLVIRTSGEQRLSNFMPWESAYSELYFSEVLWPDFSEAEFDKALIDFTKRERRYGKR